MVYKLTVAKKTLLLFSSLQLETASRLSFISYKSYESFMIMKEYIKNQSVKYVRIIKEYISYFLLFVGTSNILTNFSEKKK